MFLGFFIFRPNFEKCFFELGNGTKKFSFTFWAGNELGVCWTNPIFFPYFHLMAKQTKKSAHTVGIAFARNNEQCPRQNQVWIHN